MEHNKEPFAVVEENNIALSSGAREGSDLATVAAGYSAVVNAWKGYFATGGSTGRLALSADQMMKFSGLRQACLNLEPEDVKDKGACKGKNSFAFFADASMNNRGFGAAEKDAVTDGLCTITGAGLVKNNDALFGGMVGVQGTRASGEENGDNEAGSPSSNLKGVVLVCRPGGIPPIWGLLKR